MARSGTAAEPGGRDTAAAKAYEAAIALAENAAELAFLRRAHQALG